jgi:AraC-like DNA-binding protein
MSDDELRGRLTRSVNLLQVIAGHAFSAGERRDGRRERARSELMILCAAIEAAAARLLATTSHHDRRIIAALDVIDLTIGDADLNAAAVAQSVKLSRSHFLRLFENDVGVSFSDWVSRLRMARAASLLAEGTHSIKQVAAMCGFSYTSSFVRAFKHHYAITPASFARHVGVAELPNEDTRI